ncbi:MAG: LapA family protein [Patescibacteria group bacterium]
MITFILLGLLLGAIVIIFALQNSITITVSFLAWQFTGPLTFILLAAVASGLLISSFLSLPDYIRQALRISRLKDKTVKLQETVVEKEIEVEKEKIRVEEEKSKLDATNAYIDDLEKPTPKV